MSVTKEQVLAESGAGAVDEDLAERVLAEAVIHVEEFITANLLDAENTVPDEIEDSAVLRCAVDLFARAKAPFGTQIVPDGSGQMVAQRIGADPLGGVRSILARWCTPDLGIA
jgi:hypothetical protein